MQTLSTSAIIKKLQIKGHSADSANRIVKEAINSSNPTFILDYWGLKNTTIAENEVV